MAEPSHVDLVGVGLNATDTLIFLPEFPACGSKIPVQSVTVSPGGQVATAVIACQRWGLRTRYVGVVGDDQAARVHQEEFERAGTEACLISVPNCPSAQSIILIDERGERTVLWGHDSRLSLRPEELDRNCIVNARALLVDGCDTEAAIAAAKWAREAGVPVIADLDKAYAGIEDLLEKIDYLIVSRDFPEQLLLEPDLSQSLPMLQGRFHCAVAAATLGIDGVLAWDGREFHHACAYRVPVVDTTGAGDIFHAGFIYALLQGWPLQRQLDFACAAAALNCEAPGARGRIASVREIEDLMASGERHSSAVMPLGSHPSRKERD
jgi:sulfofructose kinase